MVCTSVSECFVAKWPKWRVATEVAVGFDLARCRIVSFASTLNLNLKTGLTRGEAMGDRMAGMVHNGRRVYWVESWSGEYKKAHM